MLKSGLIFVIAAAAGWGLSSFVKVTPETAVPEKAKPVAVIEKAVPKQKWTREDVLRSAKERAEQVSSPGFNAYEEVVADWTTAEIRAALEASLKHPGCLLSDGPASELPASLLGVWMKRDLDAALAWMEALETGTMKRKLLQGMASRWPLERAAEGVDYLASHRDSFPGVSGSLILNKAIQHSTGEGPEAVKVMIRKIQDAGLEFANLGEELKVPEDFNFQTLMDSPELDLIWENGIGEEFARQWFAQDREAAYAWTQRKHGLESVFNLTYRVGGNLRADMQWLGGKVEAMNADQQEVFFGSVDSAFRYSPSFAGLLVEGLKDPALQEQTLLRYGAAALNGPAVPDALALLEKVSEPSKRIAAIQQVLSAAEGEGIERKIYLNAKSHGEFLRRKLGEWQATPEQIEFIMKGLAP
ncbi:hypothetical protein [Luteolibacter luteus]|uniref:Uncharacterized protein n=1 Tax=Luteolibacter luteus TaxID=2728835 RepID=A0A858RCS3_9BACT|nr:hypothetical protein [Luteolibacter luteus]QJE94404.1 hypothetical protein HHL09_00915 [Luteolibacter luteus]